MGVWGRFAHNGIKMKNTFFSAVEYNKEIHINPVSILGVKKVKIPKVKKKKHKIKKEKIKKPRKIIRSYKVYIKSALWVKRKNRYFQKHGKICKACGKKKFVTLHHKIYRNNYGDEPDNEVVALCQFCHQLFHDTYGVKKDMLDTSNSFVLEMQRSQQMLNELKRIDSFIEDI